MRYFVVICILLAAISEAVAADMTHEETVVRTAYAKFAYAVQLGTISELAREADGHGPPVSKQHAAMTSDQRLAAAQVNFTLKNFSVGNMSDIVNRKIGDFVTPPEGKTLAANGNSMAHSEAGFNTRWDWIELSWKPANPAPIEGRWLTVGDAYRLQWHEQRPETLWQRYASYTVAVSFQGESRGPYKAMFLFGHDAQGNEVVEPVDTITGATGLAYAMHDYLFPEVFLRTHLRNYPVVTDWLNANQMSDAACSVGQHDVCCDLIRLKCGPGREDMVDALSKPLPQSSLQKPKP